MGRPPTPIGAYGVISTLKLPPTKSGQARHLARTYFKAQDGSLRLVGRQATTKTQAIAKLKEALVDYTAEATGEDIHSGTRFNAVADRYLEEIELDAKLGTLSPGTVSLYRRALKNWVRPALGQLRCREIRVSTCDRVVKNALLKRSYDTAKLVKAALSGACDFAVRHDAMDANPVRSLRRMTSGGKKEILALTAKQRVDLLAELRSYVPTRQNDSRGRPLGVRGRIWLDLPDIMEAMLATGVRIGELLAIHGTDVTTTVAVTHHVVRVAGQGLVRRPLRKGGVDGLVLAVPEWSTPMWERRRQAAGDGPLFASFTGELLDPSNVVHRIEEAMTAVGYGWVTSHVFRKTVGLVLDEADRPTTAIADQLGNTPAVTERHYRKRRASNQANVPALEGMFESDG
ncbi:tyrosine-type recombinase/integrase [Amycolatopsis japonica]|uniref:tyrosine-type recombinase/integrase n=1 Tax=Amycolatopsis japonica TaxID=208439 RepID=UPI003670770D